MSGGDARGVSLIDRVDRSVILNDDMDVSIYSCHVGIK